MSQCQANDDLPLTETSAPGDQDAVAGVVQKAWREETPLYPIGGGTQLSYGARASVPGLGLSMAGLNRVVDYPARDLTITVEGDAGFEYRLAGHVETGKDSVSDPAMGWLV